MALDVNTKQFQNYRHIKLIILPVTSPLYLHIGTILRIKYLNLRKC